MAGTGIPGTDYYNKYLQSQAVDLGPIPRSQDYISPSGVNIFRAKMKLLTKEIRKQLPALGATDDQADPIAIVKFFNPTGIGTWWACEFDPETGIFFGKADLGFPELGSFSLDELQSYKGPFGLGIERDIHFTPKPLSQCK